MLEKILKPKTDEQIFLDILEIRCPVHKFAALFEYYYNKNPNPKISVIIKLIKKLKTPDIHVNVYTQKRKKSFVFLRKKSFFFNYEIIVETSSKLIFTPYIRRIIYVRGKESYSI